MIRYREYRLLKDLPDAKAGTILILDPPGENYDYMSYSGCPSWYKRKYVEDNPEFFELIKEEPKEWEIISYNHWKTGGVSLIPSMHKDDPTIIHSVKRISDGEVFTIGDEVEYRMANAKGWSDVCGHGKINLFKIAPLQEHKIETEIDDNHRWKDGYYPNKYLENIRHKPKEVFTWDDALACEWAGYLHSKFEMGNSAADIPTILPQWKEKKQSKTTPLSKEIIEVTEFYYECSTANGKEYVIATNKTIPNEKHKDIIKAIEAVLNNEKLYTKFDVDILMKDAFTAGRGRFVNQKNGETEYDYPTLESYLTHLSNNTK